MDNIVQAILPILKNSTFQTIYVVLIKIGQIFLNGQYGSFHIVPD